MFLNFKHDLIVYNDNLGEINLADYYINSISIEATPIRLAITTTIFENYNLVLNRHRRFNYYKRKFIFIYT